MAKKPYTNKTALTVYLGKIAPTAALARQNSLTLTEF